MPPDLASSSMESISGTLLIFMWADSMLRYMSDPIFCPASSPIRMLLVYRIGVPETRLRLMFRESRGNLGALCRRVAG